MRLGAWRSQLKLPFRQCLTIAIKQGAPVSQNGVVNQPAVTGRAMRSLR